MRDLAPGEKIRPHTTEDLRDVVATMRHNRARRLAVVDEAQLLSHLLFMTGFVILEHEEYTSEETRTD